MSEIKCPHCQKLFKIDRDEYLEIVTQIKNHEFNSEIKKFQQNLVDKFNNEKSYQ